MANLQAFMVQGYSSLVAASSSTASTPTPLGSTSGTTSGIGSVQGCRASNIGAVPVYLAFAPTSAVQAACPTTALPALGTCLQSSQSQIYSVPPNAWVSAATSAGSATVFITPGFGQ